MWNKLSLPASQANNTDGVPCRSPRKQMNIFINLKQDDNNQNNYSKEKVLTSPNHQNQEQNNTQILTTKNAISPQNRLFNTEFQFFPNETNEQQNTHPPPPKFKFAQLFQKAGHIQAPNLTSSSSADNATIPKQSKEQGGKSSFASFFAKFQGERKRKTSIDATPQEILSQSAPVLEKQGKSSGNFNIFKAVAMLRRGKVAPIRNPRTPEEIRKLFRRSYIQVLTLIRLNKICEEIRNFGTSPVLFDVAVRSRQAVKKVLFPLSLSGSMQLNQFEDKKVLQFPLLEPDCKFLTIWNPILVGLIFYIATILPFRIAFQDDVTLQWEIFDFVIDGLFWVDLVINMISSYYDEDNQLILERHIIIFAYLKSWFLPDLLCCLPIETIVNLIIDLNSSSSSICSDTSLPNSTSNSSSSCVQSNSSSPSNLKLLKLVKLPRIYRLLKIAKIVKMAKYFGQESKLLQVVPINTGILRLIKLFCLIAVVVHFIGCFWYYEAKLNDFDQDTWVYRADLIDATSFQSYLYSIYFVFTTVTTVGYGDITPFENSEIIMTLILMVIGVAFYSSTIGILSSVIEYMDSKQVLLSQKLEIMNEYCNEMKIPNQIRLKLTDALKYTLEKNCFVWANQSKIFDSLPINLQYEICTSVHRGIMQTFSFFNLTEDQSFVVKMVPQLRPLKLQAGDIIWEQNDLAESFYLLSSGRVNFLKKIVEDVQSKEKKFKTMINGSYFGEIDLILDRRRTYKCQAETQCELYYITREDYESIIRKEFPHVHEILKKMAFEREKKNEDALTAIKKLIKQAKKIADTDFKRGTITETGTIILKLSSLPSQKIKDSDNNTNPRNPTQALQLQQSKFAEHEKAKPIHKFQRVVKKIQLQALYESNNLRESEIKKEKEDLIAKGHHQEKEYENLKQIKLQHGIELIDNEQEEGKEEQQSNQKNSKNLNEDKENEKNIKSNKSESEDDSDSNSDSDSEQGQQKVKSQNYSLENSFDEDSSEQNSQKNEKSEEYEESFSASDDSQDKYEKNFFNKNEVKQVLKENQRQKQDNSEIINYIKDMRQILKQNEQSIEQLETQAEGLEQELEESLQLIKEFSSDD